MACIHQRLESMLMLPRFPENERLDALYRYQILDTPPEATFDRITKLATQLLKVPISLISLVDRDRIWFKSRQGLDHPQVDREGSFCSQAMLNDGIFLINDTTQDPHWCNHPLVTGEFGLRFYAASPLCTSAGQRLGTLCIMDHHPRNLSETELSILQSLGELVIEQLDLRLAVQQLQQTEMALRSSEDRFRALVEQAADAFFLHDFDGRILDVNQFACQSLGYSRWQLLTLSIYDIEANFESRFLWQNLVPNQPITVRRIYYRQDRTSFPVEVRLGLIEVNGRQLIHALARDISDRLEIEKKLRQQAKRERLNARLAKRMRESLDLMEILKITVTELQQVLDADRVVILRFNSDHTAQVLTESVIGSWLSIQNRQFTENCLRKTIELDHTQKVKAVTDINNAALTPCHIEFLRNLQVCSYLFSPILQGDKMWGLLVAHQCSGTREWQTWEQELLTSLASQLAIAIQQSELYHQLEKAYQDLKYLASYDSLTGVANRRYFDDYLRNQWQCLSEEKAPLSIILCDLDFFKGYNDTYGHLIGDAALRQVAQAIYKAIPDSTHLVARYGGEEFAIILPHINEPEAIAIAQIIQAKVEQLKIPHRGSKVSSYMTCSLGIATMIPSEDLCSQRLIALADQGLYQAKANGRNQFIACSAFPSSFS